MMMTLKEDQEDNLSTKMDLKRIHTMARPKWLTHRKKSQKRLEKQETTLALLPSTLEPCIKLESRAGRSCREKHRREAKQFENIKGPEPDNTALFRLDDNELRSSQAWRLVSIHKRL